MSPHLCISIYRLSSIYFCNCCLSALWWSINSKSIAFVKMFDRSLINVINSKESRRDPWGTPEFAGIERELRVENSYVMMPIDEIISKAKRLLRNLKLCSLQKISSDSLNQRFFICCLLLRPYEIWLLKIAIFATVELLNIWNKRL